MRADRLRLLDAIEQIKLIREFSQPGRESFFWDVLRQKVILHCLALLGEACRGISPELRELTPTSLGIRSSLSAMSSPTSISASILT